ncbi:MAG: glycosyltransferase [Ruthenibacterium sp.]
MNTPKVSVIVPVYNTAERLPRCIASLCAQTMQDIEILLIDDGSTDKSGEICNQFAQKDARIQVFHKKNGGVSSARNVGLAQAKGSYISFVDSDDAVTPEMMAQLYTAAQAADAQVVFGAFVRIYQDGTQVKSNEKITNAVYHGEQIAQQILYPLLGPNPQIKDCRTLESISCRGLYSAELIAKEVSLFFEPCTFSEDLVFLIDILTRCDCAATTDAVIYHYYINESSATERYRADKLAKMKESYDITQQHCKADGVSEAVYRPRTAALFLGLASVCAKQICAAVPQQLSKAQALAALAAFDADAVMQDALMRCQWQKLPLLLRVFCFCAKHHCETILYILVRTFLKMQEIKE